MTAFFIVFAVIILKLLIPVGVIADYGKDGFKLLLKAGFVRFSPDFSKKKPKKKSKKEKKSSKLDFSLDEWVQTVRIALNTLGRLGKKIVFERVRIVYISSASDPFDAAMHYNTASALLHTLAPLFEQKFTVKSRDITLDTDFDCEKSVFEFGFTASVRLWHFLIITPAAAIGFLKILTANKRNAKYERMASHG